MVTECADSRVLRANPTMTRLVLNISRMTVHNGPGIRTLILFKGCPLRCLWCSTPESQNARPEIAIFPERCIHCNECLDVCPARAIRLNENSVEIDRAACDGCGKCVSVCNAEALRQLGRPVSVAELVSEARKDTVAFKHSHGGVTLSGGEPLLQPEFTVALVRTLAETGISIGVDTCGYVPRATIERVLPYVDFFLWDIKLLNERRHRDLTGVSNRRILGNLRFVSQRGVPVYIRIPLIPGYTDTKENLEAACRLIRGLASVVEVGLLPLHHLGRARYLSLSRAYPIEGVPLIPEADLWENKRLVESHGLTCNIIG
jgi:pyruvate formate lyase activating enzyme